MGRLLPLAVLARVFACGTAAPAPGPLDYVAQQLVPAPPAQDWAGVDASPPRARPTNGQAQFLQYCAGCHGAKGDGHGPFAANLRAPPADLTVGDLEIKSTPATSRALESDVFRTLTTGIPASGMPSFAAIPAPARWAIVGYVTSLSPRWDERAEAALDLGAEPAAAGDGAGVYVRAGCAACHGPSGRGDGPSAAELAVQPTDFGVGPGAFKHGASARDILRTLLTGMGGSPMPSYSQSGFSRGELWAVSKWVAAQAAAGRAARVREWHDFLAATGFKAPSGTKNAAKTVEPVQTPGADGCLRCHASVEVINDKMQPALLALSAQRPGVACTLCHEGNADGATEGEAHAGLIPNPGSLWVVGLGMGCAKCHSTKGALTTFQGRDLPMAVGGRLMNVVSKVSDPTGATGSAHAYRVPRGLMAAELGKATTTMVQNGLAAAGPTAFADVTIDDPDGPVPTVGSAAYRRFIGGALDRSFMRRIVRADPIPAYDQGLRLFGGSAEAAVGEFFREDCARCHLWDRGFPGAGGRYRSEGCSACHVLYPVDDPTKKRAPGGSLGANHPIAHRITAQIPSFQCAHCHWRGGGYYADLHYTRGMECVDCHGSIDVHGDGNVYPTMHLQVEVACEDCHGTPTAYPWELPVGYGTPAALPGQRGFADIDGVQYLLTSRGNARTAWQKRGDTAVLLSESGHEHPMPLLKNLHLHGWSTEGARVAMDAVPGHMDKLECLACHVKKVVQCQGCHVDVDMRGNGIDWVDSAHERTSPWARADHLEGRGHSEFSASPKALVEPALGVDLQGRVTGLVPGCLLNVDVTGPDGKKDHLEARGLTPSGRPRATLAPLIPHATSKAARSCESCHTNPVAMGYGVANDRDAPPDSPPTPERKPGKGRRQQADWSETEADHGLVAGGGTGFTAPLDVNRLVTRGGEQVKSLADQGETPLSLQQRQTLDREGTCLACHRHSGTPEWERVKARLGPATTPELHDQAVAEILEAFMGRLPAQKR